LFPGTNIILIAGCWNLLQHTTDIPMQFLIHEGSPHFLCSMSTASHIWGEIFEEIHAKFPVLLWDHIHGPHIFQCRWFKPSAPHTLQ